MMCMKTAVLNNNDILFSILVLTLCQSKQYLSTLCKYNNIKLNVPHSGRFKSKQCWEEGNCSCAAAGDEPLPSWKGMWGRAK